MINWYISCTVLYTDVFRNGLPVIKWPEIVEDDIERETDLEVLSTIVKNFTFFIPFFYTDNYIYVSNGYSKFW